jgi:hypothetical protein
MPSETFKRATVSAKACQSKQAGETVRLLFSHKQ